MGKKDIHLPSQAGADLMKTRAYWVVSGMLSVAVVTTTLGVTLTTRIDGLSITGYLPGIIFAFGSVLSILGLTLDGNSKQLLSASILFFSLGIVMSSMCVVLDGVHVLTSIDLGPLWEGRCQYYSGGKSFMYGNHFASVSCQGLGESCNMSVRSGTCYCCDLYDCANGGYLNKHYEFAGVQSCQEVLFLCWLIFCLIALNLLALILGLVAAALLGNIKALNNTHAEASLFGLLKYTVRPSAPPLPERTAESLPLPLDQTSCPAAQANQSPYQGASLHLATMGTDISASDNLFTQRPPPSNVFHNQ